MNQKISKESYAAIITSFQHGESSTFISRKYGVSEHCIVSILKRNGITMRPKSFYRKYRLNEKFFETPTQWNETQSYIFGFILGDGHNAVKIGTLQISLANKDRLFLEKINHKIQDKPLTISDKTKYREKYHTKTQNQVRMSVYSKKISDDLLSLGVSQNKTIECHFPNFLSPENMRHFVRGLIDADGCFNYSDDRLHFALSGNKFICDDFLLYLKQNSIIKIGTLIKDKRSKICYAARIDGQSDVKSFYDFLYKNATLFLERKKKICDNYFSSHLFLPTTKFKRISKCPNGKYAAYHDYGGRKTYIGVFATAEEAAKASDMKLIADIGLERAKYKTNFPISIYEPISNTSVSNSLSPLL
jgi:hypothetical protein